MEFEEIIHLMRAIVQASVARGMSLPKLFRVEWEGGKVLEVPGEVLRPAGGTAAPPSPARRQEDDGPATIAAAIRLALFLRDKRLTGGQLVQAIRDEWPDRGWDADSVGTEASRMVREGELKNYREDPQDGRGKGYSRIDWEPTERDENGGSNGG